VRRLLSPTVVVPAVLSLSLLGALLAFGDVGQIGDLLGGFQPLYIAAIVLLLVAYEVVQCTQWNVLLTAEGIQAPLRARLFAYLVGDMARVLPIGNYFENYLLLRESGTDFGRSSAATTLSVLIEVAVCLTGLVILGIGPWVWLRPLIVGGLAVFLLAAWGIRRHYHRRPRPRWVADRPAICKLLDELRQFQSGVAALLHPRVLSRAAALGACYVVLGGSVLFLVVRGLGFGSLAYGDVLAVYFFSIAFALIFPLPVDIGVFEASGTGAFLAIGLSRSDAVSAMLLSRLFTTGTAVVVAIGAIVILRDQVPAILRSRPDTGDPSPAGGPTRKG
jgi:hypothetical protein